MVFGELKVKRSLLWYGPRPWYGVRFLSDGNTLINAGLCEFLRVPDGSAEADIQYLYYPRLWDFIRHVQCFGFPRLYCPVFSRIASFFASRRKRH
ncbi:hypothetical protein AD951_04320 [Acetobacter malorum]|uniref:Uncharacterized protein n=1 Tax=Acetobacter malorum TaxID=178901 RepID=A0A149UQ77_9PROT|nr:hypothetical protein AD951_04320 [Acetobacter malorum]KXV75344.1 hypothetical protein AD953_07840 [Acetobacter malorum]